MNCSECDSLQNTQSPTPSHREILFWPTPLASEPEIRTNPYLPPGTYNSQDIRFGWLPPARLIFKFSASRNLTSRERPLLAGKYLK